MLKFFETRFPRDEEGKILITPTQGLESYWIDVVNDTPSVAGLHAACKKLLALDNTQLSQEQRSYVEKISSILPDIPMVEVDGKQKVDIAKTYGDKITNSEVPEMYTIFPYRLYNLASQGKDKEIALHTFNKMKFKGLGGWMQGGQMAAILGLEDEAEQLIRASVAIYNIEEENGFWGGAFDWIPDQDHGCNLMTSLQNMLVQSYDGKAYILPAFPKGWNVKFKLHIPKKGIVECDYRDGKFKNIESSMEYQCM